MPALGGWLVTITHGYLNGRRNWLVDPSISSFLRFFRVCKMFLIQLESVSLSFASFFWCVCYAFDTLNRDEPESLLSPSVRWFAEHGTHLRSTFFLEMEGFIDGPVVHLSLSHSVVR